jgi:alpha-tubulin suppressor-like RCC1 family protein
MVSVGASDICGIVISTARDTKGAIYCFGDNSDGQLGGTPAVLHDSAEPIQVGDSTDWKGVTVGDAHVCAISISDQLWCIGDDSSGQLGLDNEYYGDDRYDFTNTGLVVASVVAGRNFTCVLDFDGTASCAGNNEYRQITGEEGASYSYNYFKEVSGGHKFTSLAAGSAFTCGVAKNTTDFPADAGIAYCWGANWSEQTGSSSSGSNVNAPTSVPGGATFLSLQAGEAHACGLTTTSAVYCWGDNNYGQSGEAPTIRISAPHQIGTASNWAEIAVGGWTTCARTVATARVPSATYCWGDRSSAGNGIPNYYNVPTKLPGSSWLSVATNSVSRCAIAGAALPGKLYCAGGNWNGEVGDSTYDRRTSLFELQMPSGWREVAMGARSTCAISGVGALYCWGSNRSGLLGIDSDDSERLQPTQVGVDTDWSGVSVGAYTACAIKGTTSVYCWGSDNNGLIGNGDGITDNQFLPSLVDFSSTGSHAGWRKVSVGDHHVCALDTANQLYCWGSNGDGWLGIGGQLGDGTFNSRSLPVRSIPGMRFTDVSAGFESTCGVAVGGATWCWGLDWFGNLGGGAALPSWVFSFMGADRIDSAFAGGSSVRVEAGAFSNCSIKRGGDLYCWGKALGGAIPVGRDQASAIPTKVGSNFVTVDLGSDDEAFYNGGCGIKSDTTLWCWGPNFWNQFQNGAIDEYSTPQLVKILFHKPVADGDAQFTGRAKKNSVLTADAPNFSGTPIPAVTYQWYRCTKAASASSASVPSTCTKITSATGSTYTLKTADVNKYVRLLITAKNKGGTVTILTASSAKVAN